MTLRVFFAADRPRHAEAEAIARWLGTTPGLAPTSVPVSRIDARTEKGAVVWVHGVEPMALESLGTRGPAILAGGRLLLTGGAAVLPAAAGVDPAAPNDVERGPWSAPAGGAATPLGHGSFRGHPLFERLGHGADTWRPAPGEEYLRVCHVRPHWPLRGRVLAVERAADGLNADRATLWELDGEAGVTLCIGAYLCLHAADSTERRNAARLAHNALRYVAGELAPTGGGVWRLPDMGAEEDRTLAMPELPLLEESLGSLDFRLRAAGTVARGRPFTVAGRRALAVGDEADGVEEVWVHPVRLAQRPGIVGAVAETVTVTPVGVERRLRVGRNLVVERVVVPREGAACFLEWYARDGTASFAIEWETDLRLAHPYPDWATAPLRWRRAGRGAVVAGGAGGSEDRAVFAFSARPDRLEVEDRTDRTARLRFRAEVTLYHHNSLRLAMVGGTGDAMMPRVLKAADRTRAVVQARKGALDQLLTDRLAVRTPEPAVDQAVAWAGVRLASFLVEPPGVGTMVAAACGPAGRAAEGYRSTAPAVAAIAEACLAAGQQDRVRELVAAWGDRQGDSGQIPDHRSTGGWDRFDSPMATLLYLRLVARHLAWSGDPGPVQAEWPRVLLAYEYILRAGAPDDVQAAALRSTALAGLVHAAEAIGDRGSAMELDRAATVADQVAAALRAGRAAPPTLLDDYVAGRAAAAYGRWRAVVDGVFQGERGSWDEGSEVALAVAGLVHGLLGAEPDASRGRMVLRPRPPAGWPRLEVRSLAVGDATLDLDYRRRGPVHRFTVRQGRGVAPIRLILEPELSGGLVSASVDGEPAELEPVAAGERTRVPLQLVMDHERTVELAMDVDAPLVAPSSGR